MIIDAHAHLTAISGSPEERVDYLLRFADRMNISRICLSLGAGFVFRWGRDSIGSPPLSRFKRIMNF